MDFPVSLDSQSKIPLHRQLYEEIRRAVLSGRLKSGQRLPSTRLLARDLGISRITVTLAYDYLLSEGYLQASRGSGTFVTRHLPEELLRAPGAREPARGRGAAGQSGAGRRLAGKRLSRYGAHLRGGEWMSFDEQEPEIQFSFGRPAMDHFPMRQWMQLMNEHCRRRNLSLLDCPGNSRGYGPLREAIAAYLGKARAVSCEPEQIIVVNGSQQAIDLVARVLVDRGDAVALEEPGYIGAKKAFEVQGAQLISVPVDSAGLIVEKLKAASARGLKLAYVTPSHQFPTGVVLSLPRRLELLSWAQASGAYIIEDDYDSEYRYKGRPAPALAGLDKGESVIYIGTFSKVLFPALRLGYLVVPARLSEVFARAKWLADRHSPLLEQQVLADFIRLGHLERHIRRMRALYETRRRAVVDALKGHFGERVSIMGDNAGINVLVRFKGVTDEEQVVEKARALGVGLSRTRQFYLAESPSGEFLLNYAGLTGGQIEDGIARLAQAIASGRADN